MVERKFFVSLDYTTYLRLFYEVKRSIRPVIVSVGSRLVIRVGKTLSSTWGIINNYDISVSHKDDRRCP